MRKKYEPRKTSTKIIAIIAVLISILLISTNSGIRKEIVTAYHDFSSFIDPSSPPMPTKENITINLHYGKSEYSLLLEVNRSKYSQIQSYSSADQGCLYLYYNFTSGSKSEYPIYSTYLIQDSGNTWFPGITHALEELLVLWVANLNSDLSFHNMNYIESVFASSYNASGFWNELSQQITLGAGWVFNHVDFVGSAISELEKLLTPSTEYTQVENFVMFMFTLLSGSKDLHENKSTSQFNSVINTLLSYNVIDSSTYSDTNILNGIAHLNNVTIHNLTVSLFTDLYGMSYLPRAVSIGTSVLNTFVNDSVSMGIDEALQVAGNLAAEESVDESVTLALSDVSLSYITIGLPLALISSFAVLLNKEIQIPISYIGVEYHIEKAVFQNISEKYTNAMAHLEVNGEPNLTSMSSAANYYVIILAFISLWYYVNMHLDADNSTIVHQDLEALSVARSMINHFNFEVSATI